jgi:hypothetical protein
MKGRFSLYPQPDIRGISKMVVYAMGISFRPSRNVVDLTSLLLPEKLIQSVNRHPRRNCSHSMCSSQRVMPSFVRITLVLVSNHSTSLNVRFQSFVEVCRTPCTVDYCHDQQQQCDDSKSRQTFPRRLVVLNPFPVVRVVHAHELEKEVSHGRKVKHNRAAHSQCRFTSGEPCRRKQDGDRDRDSSDGECEFEVGSMLANHDNKLYCKSQEEEEIKLEQRNVNLFIISSCSPKSRYRREKIPGTPENVASNASLPRCACKLSMQTRHTASMPQN